MTRTRGLSIIVPTYNEAENVTKLARRIVKVMSDTDIPYEIIFIDDHSTDLTRKKIKSLSQAYPISTYVKKGKVGKGYSIYQGFTLAKYEHIAMIDADLQYPPELLPELYEKALVSGFAVANRKTYNSNPLRRFLSRANMYVFGKLLLKLDTDIQSGLKVFHREVFERLDTHLVSAWAIDIPLIHTAYNLGFTPGHVDMDFHPRDGGDSKVNLIRTSWEIAKGALLTWATHTRVHIYPSEDKDTMLHSGFAYKRKRFVTHTSLPHQQSALVTFIGWQRLFLVILLAGLSFGLFTNPLGTAIFCVGILSTVYFLDVLFNLYVVLKSLHFPPEIQVSDEDITALDESKLPIYTVLCPLYREARVLLQFVEAMSHMDWPKAKLDVLLLLEEDDTHTIKAAESMSLPSYIRTVIVPHSEPKTKPKASNYGLSMAKGEYVVVYDAEDKPEPTQLKKAYIAFTREHSNVVCLQAKLNYYNPHHNLLTRLFTAEYSLWFDVILPGLQSINTTIPLGGTSNHFRKAKLLELQGWDPFNVTEDCDLGARLFARGYTTAIIDSTTMEEANSDAKNWFRQRSRWIKGYIQTYLVQMRNPIRFMKEHGWHALIFQLIVGGRISFMLINPLLWAITISYFALYRFVGPTIESLYPTSIFYMAVTSLVFGNFIYLYNYMIGSAKRGHWDLVKYTFFMPFYWLMMSISAVIAVYQLFFKPHFWEKTIHGLHLDRLENKEKKRLYKLKINRSMNASYARIAAFADTRIFGGGLLIAGSFLGNLLNFIYNSYLGRHLKLEDFGEIILIGSILNMLSVPFGSYMKTITYRSAYLLGMHKDPVRPFWQYQRRIAFFISAGIAIVWIISIPFLQGFFHTNDKLPLLMFTPVLLIGLVASVDSGYLSGNLKFRILSVVLLIEPISKLLATYILIQLGLNDLVVSAVPISQIVAFGVGWYLLNRIPYKKIDLSVNDIRHFPKRFMTGAILNKISTVLFMNMDILLAKHFLSPIDAGSYAFISLGGKMVYYSSNMFSQFINPLTAHAEGARKNSSRTFGLLMIPIVLSTLISYILIGIFGRFTVPFLFGSKTIPIVPYLPLYALSIASFSIASSITTYYLAKRKYIYPVINFIITAAQVGMVFAFHKSIGQFITVMVVSGIANLICVFSIHLYFSLQEEKLHKDSNIENDKKLRILIFNWRDTKHKWRGGAEVYIHELAKRWVTKGHTVTVFSGNDGTCVRNEVIDGVQIIRRGGTYLVYVWACIYYLFAFKGHFDIIIDSENGIPFFTPLFVKEKKYLLIHHVHQEVFRKSLRPPFSWIGMILERRVMPIVYRNTEVITVSPSSKADILAHKLTNKEPHIVYNGVDLRKCVPGKKHQIPTVLYLGRLTSLKSIHVLIHAAKQVVRIIPNVRFVIAGFGPELSNLTKLVKHLGLDSHVEFVGKVTEKEKIKLYQESWVFVNPSLIEGWGITTIEANACGTPVIASNVAGLRDAVHNPHSGLLVPYGDVNEFTDSLMHLLTHTKTRNTMSHEAIRWSSKFDWEISAKQFEKILLSNDAEEKNVVTKRPYDIGRLLIASFVRYMNPRIRTKQVKPLFPESVGPYTFVKSLVKHGPKHSYEIGLYRSPTGALVFAKMRSSAIHDYHYLSLKNEIHIYTLLSRVQQRLYPDSGHIHNAISIPALLDVYEDRNVLMMFLEYRSGRPISTNPVKDRVSILFRSTDYLADLYKHMLSEEIAAISKRTPTGMMTLLPFITASTLVNRALPTGILSQALRYLLRHYISVAKNWSMSLVHRDLHFNNILAKDKATTIIDLQQCVASDPLQEYVTILRYYWHRNPAYRQIHDRLLQKHGTDPGFAEKMRWLSVQSVIHGLTDASFSPEIVKGWKSYLAYALSSDSFTKELSS